MPDEIINNEEEQAEVTAPEKVEPKSARSDNRFKDLSEKVELTAKERDEANAAKAAAEKEVEFYKGFSKLKYPEAADFQDKIKEKVMAGYEMEDAAISVLAKAGKLQGNPTSKESPAGGSATNAITNTGDKPISEMTEFEKREALIEQDRLEPGSLAKTLRAINLG